MEKNENFSFTYSAQQQKEVEAIRNKYLPKEEDKMAQLRKLHQVPTQKAQTVSLILGIIGSLIMGTGMSLIMTDIGAKLGIFAMILGVVCGLVGIVLVASAYPMYNRILKKEREKIAPDILRLADELMQ